MACDSEKRVPDTAMRLARQALLDQKNSQREVYMMNNAYPPTWRVNYLPEMSDVQFHPQNVTTL